MGSHTARVLWYCLSTGQPYEYVTNITKNQSLLMKIYIRLVTQYGPAKGTPKMRAYVTYGFRLGY
jgi:hypothetical protein